MARWYRSGRYYGRRRGYYGGRRRYYSSSSSSRRSYGNYKSAKQQTDNATFTINIPSQCSIFCQEQNIASHEHVYGVYPMNVYDLLRKSEFYQNYANMYDEFKIENIKIKLMPTSWTTTTDSTEHRYYNNLTVYTAWDRTGLNDAQLDLITEGQYTNDAISETDTRKKYSLIGKDGDQDGLYCTVGDDITTYSSAESRQISVGTNTTITRWLKPKTITEKGQWLSTASLKKWYEKYEEGGFKEIPTYIDGDVPDASLSTNLTENGKPTFTLLTRNSPAIANNPCFIKEDPAISFKPTLLVGLYPKQSANDAIPNIVDFSVETEVVCTFRGLRKSSVVR